MRPTLVTERLRLEPLTADHAEHLVALDGDAEVMRHLTGRPRSRQEVLEEWLPTLSRDAGPGGQLGYWAGFVAHEWSQTPSRGAVLPAFGTNRSPQFAGWWALNPDPEDPTAAELGYRLRRDHWRRGLATEGALALLAHGFETVGLRRIWAQTMAVNAASRGVMAAVGMSLRRTWVGEWNEPLPGWEQGEVEFAITREEWAAARL